MPPQLKTFGSGCRSVVFAHVWNSPPEPGRVKSLHWPRWGHVTLVKPTPRGNRSRWALWREGRRESVVCNFVCVIFMRSWSLLEEGWSNWSLFVRNMSLLCRKQWGNWRSFRDPQRFQIVAVTFGDILFFFLLVPPPPPHTDTHTKCVKLQSRAPRWVACLVNLKEGRCAETIELDIFNCPDDYSVLSCLRRKKGPHKYSAGRPSTKPAVLSSRFISFLGERLVSWTARGKVGSTSLNPLFCKQDDERAALLFIRESVLRKRIFQTLLVSSHALT